MKINLSAEALMEAPKYLPLGTVILLDDNAYLLSRVGHGAYLIWLDEGISYSSSSLEIQSDNTVAVADILDQIVVDCYGGIYALNNAEANVFGERVKLN